MLAASLRQWAFDTVVEVAHLRSNRKRAKLERDRRQARALVLSTLRTDCPYHDEPITDVEWGSKPGEWFGAAYLCGCVIYPHCL